MLFNSIEFLLFLPIVFFIYWFLVNKSLKLQNLFILISSYFFYGWWDWRFLLLIAFTSLCSYGSGLWIHQLLPVSRQKAKWISGINIVINLFILAVFKYYNFFADNLAELIGIFGLKLDWVTLDILLPVGISFYTFQALSYTIDVYKRKIEPTKDIVAFFAFISFFPQLVAGPIERATNLLPQFYVKRSFDYRKAVDGMRQILWGFFKKIVIADNCAYLVDLLFNDFTNYSGSTLFLGAVLFAFQIYGDFSGYSDIAIGTARLFGFSLMRNFNYPYFSRDIAEFWRRWHISLTTWFRDYIYIPLGGSRGTKWMSLRNTFIIFLVSGFWHGANWTFICWGLYHAVLFIPLLLIGKNRKNTNVVAEGNYLPSLKELFQISLTFILAVFGWIIFRANDMHHAASYIREILSSSIFNMPELVPGMKVTFLFILVLLIIEWIGRSNQFALERIPIKFRPLRWLFYLIVVFMILVFGGEQSTFIYFQF